MTSTDSTTGLSQNDSRRRVTRTPIVSGWAGSAPCSKVLSDNVGLAQHQIWYASDTAPSAGTLVVSVRAAKANFFVPIASINLATTPSGCVFLPGIIDDVMLSVTGLTGTLLMDAGIMSVGIDFTPTGNRSLVDRRRFQVKDVASGWNGAAAISVDCSEHAGMAQHQLTIAGGSGNVTLFGRPIQTGKWVAINSDTTALSSAGKFILFPGLFDGFKLAPAGTVTGSINAHIVSVGQELILPITKWQSSAAIGN